MSAYRHRPEHLIIREYIEDLVRTKSITWSGLRDAFVPIYIEYIPQSPDVPVFDPVHRHDTAEDMEHKNDANLKKLVRALQGKTHFPLCFKNPLIMALDTFRPELGLRLRKQLLRNDGLLYIPIDQEGSAEMVYSNIVKEFAEANTAMVEDMGDDGRLNNANTREELIDLMEVTLSAVRDFDKQSKDDNQ